MPAKLSESNVVSLRSYKALFDHYGEFCRQLKFLIRGGFTSQEEGLALEVISEFLDQKEKEVDDLRKKALEECEGVGISAESMEVMLGRYVMQHEDYRLLRRIKDIRGIGGTQWEALKAALRDSNTAESIEE